MAGTNKRLKNISAPAPVIILLEPQLAENIGMVARAMANFGMTRLRLVRPRESLPNAKATAAASKADHILEKAELFTDAETALADLQYVLATTARQREGFKPVLSPIEAAKILRLKQEISIPDTGEAQSAEMSKTGILFGRERFGLSNAELSLADALVTFPVNPAFASLNIAQAVLLMAYEWQKSGLAEETATLFRGPLLPQASKAALYSFLHRLEEALEVRGYFRPPERKPIMVDNLRAVLSRAEFTEAELKLLGGVIASLDRFGPRKNTKTTKVTEKLKGDSDA